MRTVHSLATLFLAALPAVAQDFLYLKFDANCTNEVINYANGAQRWAGTCTLESNTGVSPFTGGVFGGALAGGSNTATTSFNRVLTGWNPSTQPVTGDLTIAWFMRERPGSAIGTTLNYLMGAASGGIRLFTNGIAGRGLYFREVTATGGNGGTTGRDMQLFVASADIQTLAAAGWTHVALVVEQASLTGTWYVNGAPVLVVPNVSGAQMNLTGNFMVGAYNTAATGAGSVYELDEFLLSLRAFSAPEILALSIAPRAGDGPYLSQTTTQCGSLGLRSSGGAPALGNVTYALDLALGTPGLYALFLGFDRCSFGGFLPLPAAGGTLAPALNGCTVLADAAFSASGVASGLTASVGLPILPSVNLLGLPIFGQAVAIDVATGATSASNGFGISVGN